MTDSLTQLMNGLWGPSRHRAETRHEDAAQQPGVALPDGSHPYSGVIEGGVGSGALGQLFNGLMGRTPTSDAEATAVVGLLGYLLGGRGGADGVARLTERLRHAGLGQQVDSWIAHTSNAPLAPEDLARAFPEEALHGVERHTGLHRDVVLKRLSQGLPQMVDRLTPRGRVPQSDAEMPKDPPDRLLEGFGLSGQR